MCLSMYLHTRVLELNTRYNTQTLVISPISLSLSTYKKKRGGLLISSIPFCAMPPVVLFPQSKDAGVRQPAQSAN